MRILSFRSCFLLLISSFMASNSYALTTEQFLTQCGNTVKQCQKTIPTQYYLGGLFDALGYLNGELKKDGKPTIYCKQETELFDMEALIEFIVKEQSRYLKKNPMSAVLDFIEARDSCD